MTHWRSSRSPLADGYSPSSIRQRNYPTGVTDTPVRDACRGFSDYQATEMNLAVAGFLVICAVVLGALMISAYLAASLVFGL